MRGLKRLSFAASSLTQKMDELGDRLSAKLNDSGERAEVAIGKMERYAGEVEATVVELEQTVAQLTNDPLAGSGKD